jgi:hypothetical protein
MPDGDRPEHIIGYRLGFEGEIDWDRPTVFRLEAIERIERAEDGRARFTCGTSALEPVAFVTMSAFEEVIERLRAIH